MPSKDYTTFDENMLSEFVQVTRRYRELRARLYGWGPTKPYETFGDPSIVERIARLAGVGVHYETYPDGNAAIVCEVDGVEFSALRERG